MKGGRVNMTIIQINILYTKKIKKKKKVFLRKRKIRKRFNFLPG